MVGIELQKAGAQLVAAAHVRDERVDRRAARGAGLCRMGKPRRVPADHLLQSRDEALRVLVDANDRAGGRLDLRACDVFFATAWWTANLAHDLIADQRIFFGREPPLVYLIQDDEPYFYGWSSKHALAEAAYHKGANTLAIINSEELFETMVANTSCAMRRSFPIG